MRVHLLFIIYLMTSFGTAQTESGKVVPKVTSLPLEPGEVILLHLAPGYTTSVRLPEEIRSVVVGNPAAFKAEHSEADPRRVFLKPITPEPSNSNALITTQSGEEISLHLVSAGKKAPSSRVDFMIEYQRPRSMLIESNGPTFLVGESRSAMLPSAADPSSPPITKPDPVVQGLDEQRAIPTPRWEGKELLAAVGHSLTYDRQTILGFSVLNSSNHVIELLPPQLELAGNGHGGAGRRIKAEPIAVTGYRMTSRRLAPGQRADGVVVFERPQFKEANERVQLQVAEADEVDRPIVLAVPFTATSAGGKQ